VVLADRVAGRVVAFAAYGGVDLGWPVAAIEAAPGEPGFRLGGGGPVKGRDELRGVVEADVAARLPQHQPEKYPDRGTPASRRVGAGPGVPDGHHSSGHRSPVDHEVAVTIVALGAGPYPIVNRFAVQSVRHQWLGPDGALPAGHMAQPV
jgi:hypothetical protein